MGLFEVKVQNQLKEILKNMKDNVKIINFTQEFECSMCRDTRNFAEEIASLSDKLSVIVYDQIADKDMVLKYGVERIPAIVLLDNEGKDHGVKFYGLPGGYEINSFLGSIIEMSGRRENLPENILSRIKKIDTDVHIEVFVGLGCPHCPAAVSVAHRLAMENSRIKGDMIDSNNFIYLSQKYNVTGVPKIIINGKHELMGAHPITTFLDVIESL